MKIVLLSGGTGKRLFPLSNDVRSKQFLKVLTDDKGASQSMIQRVWAQLEDKGMEGETYVCASKAQEDIIRNQIESPRIILEPASRDTFPAIVLSTLHLVHNELIDPDEVVVFMPVDPFVDDTFFDAIAELERAIVDTGANLAVMGVTSSPSTRFGYITLHSEDESERYPRVSQFVEKPKLERAEALCKEGALWNCGVFAFRASYLTNTSWLKPYGTVRSFEDFCAGYSDIEKISFDYAVVEKEKNIVCVRYNGTWEDLGTWDTLSTHITENIIGNTVEQGCQNTLVINELPIPVVANHMRDCVIVASHDGILISDKENSTELKHCVQTFNQRPMFEERRWGTYTVLEHRRLPDEVETIVKRICVDADKNLSYQRHAHRREVWTVIKGTGLFADGVGICEVGVGDVLEIPQGSWHGLKALSDLEMIEVQYGDLLIEEDIERKFMSWDEVEQHFPKVSD